MAGGNQNINGIVQFAPTIPIMGCGGLDVDWRKRIDMGAIYDGNLMPYMDASGTVKALPAAHGKGLEYGTNLHNDIPAFISKQERFAILRGAEDDDQLLSIEIIKQIRCAYCNTKHVLEEKNCENCGAVL